MEYTKVIDHTMDTFERTAADAVFGAIQDAANGTERSAQQQAFRLGMSNIGHCQQAAVFMINQTPPTDLRDKSAAFFGTVAGAAIEAQLKLTHPDWLFQSETVFKIPSGGELGAHPDIIIPQWAAVSREEFEANEAARIGDPTLPQTFVQGVWDLKSKDKLSYVKKYGPSRQQVWQLTGYASSAIDAGILNGDQPIWLSDVYFDRSGAEKEAYAFGWWYDPAALNEIDDWIHDLKYAVMNNAEALKEKPREWCWSYCEYATLCRGNDTDVEGLIEDAEMLAAVAQYAQGLDLERDGAKLKADAKLVIPENLSGSTGEHNVRWIEIGGTDKRAASRRLDIRPVPGPKKPRTRKPKTEEVAQ